MTDLRVVPPAEGKEAKRCVAMNPWSERECDKPAVGIVDGNPRCREHGGLNPNPAPWLEPPVPPAEDDAEAGRIMREMNDRRFPASESASGTGPVPSLTRPEPAIPPPQPAPRELLTRGVVMNLHKFQSLIGQMQMQPTRDAKMNAILGNQGLIMQALMLLLDERLEPKVIQFQQQPEPASPLVVPS